ncbi:hypothetical protein [Pseudofrankia sp. DC12]|uniref:hypothetical protein n=1 Tax=Pseudofrankia sp. DC12 TaxID=683315 RepID=UPI000A8EBCB3|nr:hypothetical protein [Pseudofrankia sp. DC12]
MPWEFKDLRLHRARERLKLAEWAVVLAYVDGTGPESWDDAARAAGQTPKAAARVRRKIRRDNKEITARRSPDMVSPSRWHTAVR